MYFSFPRVVCQLYFYVTSDRSDMGVLRNKDVECISSHLSSFVFDRIPGPVQPVSKQRNTRYIQLASVFRSESSKQKKMERLIIP